MTMHMQFEGFDLNPEPLRVSLDWSALVAIAVEDVVRRGNERFDALIETLQPRMQWVRIFDDGPADALLAMMSRLSAEYSFAVITPTNARALLFVEVV